MTTSNPLCVVRGPRGTHPRWGAGTGAQPPTYLPTSAHPTPPPLPFQSSLVLSCFSFVLLSGPLNGGGRACLHSQGTKCGSDCDTQQASEPPLQGEVRGGPAQSWVGGRRAGSLDWKTPSRCRLFSPAHSSPSASGSLQGRWPESSGCSAGASCPCSSHHILGRREVRCRMGDLGKTGELWSLAQLSPEQKWFTWALLCIQPFRWIWGIAAASGLRLGSRGSHPSLGGRWKLSDNSVGGVGAGEVRWGSFA